MIPRNTSSSSVRSHFYRDRFPFAARTESRFDPLTPARGDSHAFRLGQPWPQDRALGIPWDRNLLDGLREPITRYHE
jgi:hypothetical protein